MHRTFEELATVLEDLAKTVDINLNDIRPLNVISGNWNFPAVSKADLAAYPRRLASLICESAPKDPLGSEGMITNLTVGLRQMINLNLIGNIPGNAGAAVPTFMISLDAVRDTLKPILEPNQDTRPALAQAARRVRALEGLLASLEPKTTHLNDMISRIEQAHETADQLPSDLQTLSEARERVRQLSEAADSDRAQILSFRITAEDLDKQLKVAAEEATAVVQRAETAYSAATSVGLAKAFEERSKSLTWSMWVWVGGLVLALAVGLIFGSTQVQRLIDMIMAPGSADRPMILHAFIAILSVSGPIWFGWLGPVST